MINDTSQTSYIFCRNTSVRYLVEDKGKQRELLAGHDDHGVAPDDGGREQRHEAEQRVVVGTGDADDAHWLVDLDSGAIQRRFLHTIV